MQRTSRPDQESANHEGLWQKSATPNLYRYRPSVRYFARAKVGGKLIRQSLKTSTYSVAVLRLNDLLKENRGRREISEAAKSGPMTFQQAAERLLARVDADPTLKPATRIYRRRCLDALRRTWPDLADTDVRRITPHQCQDWAADFAKRYSETMYNNTVGTLRMVLEVAVKNGVRFGNPAAEVGEAEFIRWSDCDFGKSRIHVAGDPEFGTKNGEVRWVPMNAAVITLLKRLRAERANEPPTAAVMRIQECQKAMDRACRDMDIDRITHHDLRHFFATSCIEAGIDIPTVSRWLGHKDGGALAMRVYGHLRDQHSQAMAQRVTFGQVPAEAPTAPARSTLVAASL